ncbi:MAG: hypothetical protein GQE15_24470 [Archangiaceae bacterium]|nr:hypothetical protein [Archangiaceae bacterium]
MWRWLVLGLVLGGCRERAVNMAVDTPLVVTPSRVDFGQVFVGERLVRTVTLRNEGQVARAVSFELVAPFAAAFTESSVPGGASVELELSVAPLAPGSRLATMLVDGTEVTLVAEVREVPLCAAPSACSTARFDLATRACVTEPKAEGAACSTSCVSNGVCLQGECRGSAGTCDDGNVCTQDACAEGTGCVHVPLECAPPDDPCQAAFCDTAAGCQKRAVEDGVRCGPDDCARNQARVCINGACVMRTRPQGELCFETVAGVAAGPGRVDARDSEARFFQVREAATDRWGNTWVFGGGDVRRVTPGGVVTTIIRSVGGTTPVDGVGVGHVEQPLAATTDAWGNAWVLDGSCLRRVSPTGVLSTRFCRTDFLNSRWLEVLRDGRTFVAGPFEPLTELFHDGGSRALDGVGPLAESTRGNLLFFRALDAGLTQLEAAPQGEVVVQRAPVGGDLFEVASAGSAGELLTSRNRDGGCLLSVEVDGGVPAFGTEVACNLSSQNVTTFTGSPVFFSWLGRDGEGYAFTRGVELRRLTSSGGVRVAGLAEQQGTVDGLAPGARLRVTAGFGFAAHRVDSLFVRADGVVVFSGGDDRVRTWSSATGVRTIDGGAPMSLTMLQPTDGGFLVKQSNSVSFFDGVGLSPPMGVTSFFDRELWFEPGSGGWLMDDQQLSRLEPDLSTRGGIRGHHALRDGPLPQTADDGGWVDVDDDGGTADFGFLHSPVQVASGTLAVLDGNAVRTLSASGLRTLAGSLTTGFVDGTAAAARFNGPLALNRAPNGDLYIADTENNAIRVLTPAGQVRTVGRLTDRPAAVAVAPNGDVFVLVRHALLRGR